MNDAGPTDCQTVGGRGKPDCQADSNKPHAAHQTFRNKPSVRNTQGHASHELLSIHSEAFNHTRV
eukprot:13086126-Alexandrium_andersonii.AAC.1